MLETMCCLVKRLTTLHTYIADSQLTNSNKKLEILFSSCYSAVDGM